VTGLFIGGAAGMGPFSVTAQAAFSPFGLTLSLAFTADALPVRHPCAFAFNYQNLANKQPHHLLDRVCLLVEAAGIGPLSGFLPFATDALPVRHPQRKCVQSCYSDQ